MDITTPGTSPATLGESSAVTTANAGFWLRFVAFFFDAMLIGLVISGITALGIFYHNSVFPEASFPINYESLMQRRGLPPVYDGAIRAIAYVLLVAYASISHASSHRATFGKRLTGLYVVRADGTSLSYPRALLRALLPYSLFMATVVVDFTILYAPGSWIAQNPGSSYLFVVLLCLAWYVGAAFTRQKTAFHDVLCNTRVVRRTDIAPPKTLWLTVAAVIGFFAWHFVTSYKMASQQEGAVVYEEKPPYSVTE